MENLREWGKTKQRLSAGVLLGTFSFAILTPAMAFIVEPHPKAAPNSVFAPSSTLTSLAIAQLEPGEIPVPDESPTVPDGYSDPPPEVDAPRGGVNAQLEELRVRLADVQNLPLFLPEEQGKLISASTQLSTTQLSEPTFAWIEDQLNERYGPNKRGQNEAAITQWRVYRTNDGLRYVDVVVDTGLWSQFTYFDRYAFVQQFGTAAIAKGYQLRVFHTDDVDNYIEALALEENGRDRAIARPVFLRGSYFCMNLIPELLEAFTCRLIVTR